MHVALLLRPLGALTLAASLLVGEASAQQPPPPPPPSATPTPATQPPTTAPDASAPAPAVVAPATLKIAGGAGIVLHPILPAATADFEAVMAKFFEGVSKVGDESQRQVIAGWKVAKVTEGAPGGVNALYAFLIDPVVPDADYSGTFILSVIYKAFPDEAAALHRKFVAAYAGPRHVLTLTPLLPVPAAPASPAPAPK